MSRLHADGEKKNMNAAPSSKCRKSSCAECSTDTPITRVDTNRHTTAEMKRRGKQVQAALNYEEQETRSPDSIALGNGQILAYQKRRKPTPLAVIEAAKVRKYACTD